MSVASGEWLLEYHCFNCSTQAHTPPHLDSVEEQVHRWLYIFAAIPGLSALRKSRDSRRDVAEAAKGGEHFQPWENARVIAPVLQ